MNAHGITTRSEQRFDNNLWWRAYCSCGKYTSGLYPSAAAAERPGRDHAAAKNGTPRTKRRRTPDAMELSSPRPGLIVMNHSAHLCAGTNCCIHNPSDHHMNTWSMVFRSDNAVICPTHHDHALTLTERVCMHGVGHPDPDSLTWLKGHDPVGAHWGVHGCCGCCRWPTETAHAAV